MLVARRGKGEHLAGLWEFPGGKIAPGESPEAGARRELLEETGIDLTGIPMTRIASVRHKYPDRTVVLHTFLAEPRSAPAITRAGRGGRWVPLGELPALGMPEANREILRVLAERLGPGA